MSVGLGTACGLLWVKGEFQWEEVEGDVEEVVVSGEMVERCAVKVDMSICRRRRGVVAGLMLCSTGRWVSEWVKGTMKGGMAGLVWT